MKRSNICMLAVLAGTSVAMAAPRESFPLGAMTSDARAGGATNTVTTFSALGSDGGGSYTCRSITLTATSGAQATGSYASEGRFLITPPGGTPFVVQPSTTAGAITAGTVLTVVACPVDAAVTTGGVWRVESYESFDDTGVDMAWGAVTVTLNDSSPVTPSVAGASNFSSTFTLVPSDGTTTANSGTATDAQRTRTMNLPAGTTINKVLFSGFVTTLTHLDAANTTTQYTPQTRVRVTSPIGTVLTVTPVLTTATSGTGMTNATGGVTGGTNVGGLITVPITSQDSGGTWTFLFYELTNDAPGAAVGSSPAFAGVDSVWDHVNIGLAGPTAPANPSLTAATATPTTGTSGTPVAITVTVTPGAGPTSTGLSVTANLASLGGSAAAGMNDAGLNGDATAGDGVYTVMTTIPAGATDFSTYAVTIDASDAQGRNAVQRSVTVTGQATALDEATLSGGDAGDLLATAGMFSGSGAINAIVGSTTNTAGGDAADVYKIQICNEAAFIADTRLVAGDTQLFLFDSNGMGVVANDDTTGLSARLDSTLVTANGIYYLGVTRFNVDPFDATPALIWTSNAGQAAPVATAGALASWSAATVAGSQGAYRVSLAGVCFPAPAQCSPADVGVQGGGAGQDNLLNNNDFIAFIDLFFANSPAADLGSQGGVQGADGQWNNNDFIVYIDYFFNDAALCQG